jgi:hypothetical protein
MRVHGRLECEEVTGAGCWMITGAAVAAATTGGCVTTGNESSEETELLLVSTEAEGAATELALTLTRVATVGITSPVDACTVVFCISALLKIPHSPSVPAIEVAAMANFIGFEINSFFLWEVMF